MKTAFRIYTTQFSDNKAFENLKKFINDYKDVVDEIALFTEYWHHGYYPMDLFLPFAKRLKTCVAELKAQGVPSVGINVLCTIGQTDEAWDWLPKLPGQPLVEASGKTSISCFCPNGEIYREHMCEKYTLVAQAEPDFIWVDDDIRLQGHGEGILFTCFCPQCIEIFNKRNGTKWDRQSLVARLKSDEGAAEREAWIAHNIYTIENLMTFIRETVHAVNPDIELGLMTGPLERSTYTGSAYGRWFPALNAQKGRPGGGFYNDLTPIKAVDKALQCQRQVRWYPEDIKDIQYELESFPEQKMGKSVHITMAECTLNMINGCNGIAFNNLKSEMGALDDYIGMMEGIRSYRGQWNTMCELSDDWKNAGFNPLLQPTLEAKRKVNVVDWFELPKEQYNIDPVYNLSEIGIPLSAYDNKACGTILYGNIVEACTEEKILTMLSGGIIMDANALKCLWSKGYGELCGVKVLKEYDNGIMETLTDDVLNGPYSGECRDARLSFYHGVATVFEPLDSSIRVLSNLVSYMGDMLGPGLCIYENHLGGRIAICGYAPWTYVHSGAKRQQINALADWVSNGKMPVLIEKCHKVAPFIKTNETNNKFLLLLLNTSFDETGRLPVKIRNKAHRIEQILSSGARKALPENEVSFSKDEACFVLDNIAPWSWVVIYGE